MRYLIQFLTMTAIAAFLSACGTDHNNDYLNAKQNAPLKIPPPLSNYDTQNLYTVPQGDTWHDSTPISIIPPGSSMAKKNMPQPLDYDKT